MENKEKKFFNQIWTSIVDFEGYEEFAAGKILKTIKYIVLITLIFTFVISLSYTYKIHSITQNVKTYISENINEVSIKNGKLNVETEKPLIIENEDNIIPIIIVDTAENANEDEYLEKISAYETGILLLSDKAVVTSKFLNGQENIYYSTLLNNDIEGKETLLSLMKTQNLMYIYIIFFLTIFIYLFIVYIASNLIDAVVLGALGYIFARIIKLRLKYKAAFNIGIYALTLPIILNLIYIVINLFVDFKVRYFQWMYTTISYIYVVVAILMIKTEIINQKIQLIRLQEIEEKVAREAQMYGPEEEEEDDDDDEKEKEEKEQENKETGDTSGEEPEGSKA